MKKTSKKPAKKVIKIPPSIERALPKAFQQEVDRLVKFALGEWIGVEILRKSESRDTNLAPMVTVSACAMLNPGGQIIRIMPLSRDIQLWLGEELDLHIKFRCG